MFVRIKQQIALVSLLDWNILFSHISDLSDWLPFLLFLSLPIKEKKKFSILGAYLFLMGILKSSTLLLLTFVGKVNTMPLYHIMAPLEVTLLILFYGRFLKIPMKSRIGILFLVLIPNFINTFYLQGIMEFNSNAWAINTLILIGFGLSSLFYLFKELETIELEKSPEFLINSGFLLYFAGSIFLYIVSSEVLSKEANGFFYNAWIIRSVADIIKNLIITYGLWIARSNSLT